MKFSFIFLALFSLGSYAQVDVKKIAERLHTTPDRLYFIEVNTLKVIDGYDFGDSNNTFNFIAVLRNACDLFSAQELQGYLNLLEHYSDSIDFSDTEVEIYRKNINKLKDLAGKLKPSDCSKILYRGLEKA